MNFSILICQTGLWIWCLRDISTMFKTETDEVMFILDTGGDCFWWYHSKLILAQISRHSFCPNLMFPLPNRFLKFCTIRDNDTDVDVIDERDLLVYMYTIVMYKYTQIGKETTIHWAPLADKPSWRYTWIQFNSKPFSKVQNIEFMSFCLSLVIHFLFI